MSDRYHHQPSRPGSVTVEFAVVAPVFLFTALGVTQASRLYETKAQLSTAAREGARIAAMSRDGILSAGGQTNAKIATDVINFLKAAGLPEDQITVSIKDHESPQVDFNLDDPANDLKLFRLTVSIPSTAVSSLAITGGGNSDLSATLVFRNAQAAIGQ
jgi:Flp pilus assembly protein TadG